MDVNDFDGMLSPVQEQNGLVLTENNEPLERLLRALAPGSMVFLLRPENGQAAEWLTAPRIERHLRDSLMEPGETQVWQLLPGAWAISLQVDNAVDNPDNALHVHSVRRALAARLQEEWQAEQAGELPLPTAASFLLPGETEEEQPEEQSEAGKAEPMLPVPNLPAVPVFPAAPCFSVLPVSSLRATEEMEENITELNALLEIMVNKQLHAQFQPIVNLCDGQVFGYEALIRGPKGGTLRRPGALFRAAEKARMVSWFDLACQEQCFASAVRQGLKHLLFINMEAEGLAFLDMHDRPLAIRARECGLTPASIVIEITERQTVGDFPRLMQSIQHLREQGFKIAIDDAGSGYNSLQAIAELRPDFVKIDRALVRSLDVQGERRALLSALVAYARQIGTMILGEGSETYEELGTLIDLGVTYGQGYLMGKPADSFRGVPRETREFIQQRHKQRALLTAGRSIAIGGLARAGKSVTPDTPLSVALLAFSKQESLTSLAVVENEFVRGLVMRHNVAHLLPLGRGASEEELLPGETCAKWMQTSALCVQEDEPAEQVARQATTRGDISLETDVVVVRGSNQYAGTVPIRVLMEAVTALQENRHHYANPLTALPGQVPFEQRIGEWLESRAPLAVLRIDLHGLTAYNRVYGLPHGDAALRALAAMIQNLLPDTEDAPGYVAHVNEDDFVVLIPPASASAFCGALMAEFGRQVTHFYHAEDARRGHILLPDKDGGKQSLPLMTLAIAGVTNRARRLHSYAQIQEDIHALMRQVKAQGGNLFAIDRAPVFGKRQQAA